VVVVGELIVTVTLGTLVEKHREERRTVCVCVSTVLGVQGVEEETVDNIPLVGGRRHLQQRRGAQLHAAGLVD